MFGNDFQTVVIGAGAIGSAAAYWLSERGQTDVLVLEQWNLGHANGGSEDHSRIIRHTHVALALVVDGRSSYPIEKFRSDRPALTDPAFAATFVLKG